MEWTEGHKTTDLINAKNELLIHYLIISFFSKDWTKLNNILFLAYHVARAPQIKSATLPDEQLRESGKCNRVKMSSVRQMYYTIHFRCFFFLFFSVMFLFCISRTSVFCIALIYYSYCILNDLNQNKLNRVSWQAILYVICSWKKVETICKYW